MINYNPQPNNFIPFFDFPLNFSKLKYFPSSLSNLNSAKAERGGKTEKKSKVERKLTTKLVRREKSRKEDAHQPSVATSKGIEQFPIELFLILQHALLLSTH